MHNSILVLGLEVCVSVLGYVQGGLGLGLHAGAETLRLGLAPVMSCLFLNFFRARLITLLMSSYRCGLLVRLVQPWILVHMLLHV